MPINKLEKIIPINKLQADNICTAIFLGYVKDKNDKGKQAIFEYDNDKDAGDYNAVKDKSKSLKVSVQKSVPQEKMPFIVSKTGRASSLDTAQLSTTDYWKYVKAITDKANLLSTRPYGAYIGGAATTSKLTIVGPTALETREPKYGIVDPNVSGDFSDAVTAINAALGCLKNINTTVTKPAGMNLDVSAVPTTDVTVTLGTGKVFNSYHGMIQALVKFYGNVDSSMFVFEIAMGKETCKVSSCFPCALYMEANGTPATSIHLGRGDYWNIPGGAPLLNQSDLDLLKTLPLNISNPGKVWRKNVTKYFIDGMAIMKTSPDQEYGDWLKKVQNPDLANLVNLLPDVFLDALTYSGKFTKKILNPGT